MSFKMKTTHELLGIDETSTVNRPVFIKDLEGNVGGEANRDGTTFIDPEVPKSDRQDVVDHEDIHHEQMIQGRLGYTHKEVFWKKGTRHPLEVFKRKDLKEGDENLEWEQEAYSKTKYR